MQLVAHTYTRKKTACGFLQFKCKRTGCIGTVADLGEGLFHQEPCGLRWPQRLSALAWVLLAPAILLLASPSDSSSCCLQELCAWQEWMWQLAVQIEEAGFNNKTLFMTRNSKLLLVGQLQHHRLFL